ncbi:hypothetical protein SKAU_G00203380 [Synaphobranchus kaupii]|uniref:Uncharacterized protein n=1 Tax=Synaphobranchus kaupii TaxID=118154 RepID=A0A9Q1FFY0_SYNKA|nr:hypothetical protein SKAU_G00203380 [Synaphobranchus kaupii]
MNKGDCRDSLPQPGAIGPAELLSAVCDSGAEPRRLQTMGTDADLSAASKLGTRATVGSGGASVRTDQASRRCSHGPSPTLRAYRPDPMKQGCGRNSQLPRNTPECATAASVKKKCDSALKSERRSPSLRLSLGKSCQSSDRSSSENSGTTAPTGRTPGADS